MYLLFNWNKSHTTTKSRNKHVPFHWILSHIFYFWNHQSKILLYSTFLSYHIWKYFVRYSTNLRISRTLSSAFTLSFFFPQRQLFPLAVVFPCRLFYLFLYTIHRMLNGTLAQCFPLPSHQSIPTGNIVYHVLFWPAWWFGNVLTSLIFLIYYFSVQTSRTYLLIVNKGHKWCINNKCQKWWMFPDHFPSDDVHG